MDRRKFIKTVLGGLVPLIIYGCGGGTEKTIVYQDDSNSQSSEPSSTPTPSPTPTGELNTIYVKGSQSFYGKGDGTIINPFATIQEAINHGQKNEITKIIDDWVYKENLLGKKNFPMKLKGKSIDTIVEGYNRFAINLNVLNIRNTENFEVENLRFRNGDSGIYIKDSNNITLRNCLVDANRVGIMCENSSNILLENCVVSGEDIYFKGDCGIVSMSGGKSDIHIVNSIIYNVKYGFDTYKDQNIFIDYSCMYGFESLSLNGLETIKFGENNLFINPEFIYPLNDNPLISSFRLKPESPCRNKGINGKDMGVLYEF